MQELQLVKEPIWKLFIKFVIPSILAMLIVGVEGIVDGIFLARFESIHAMSSVNLANPFMQFILGGCLMISIGMLSRMGRMLGDNAIEEANNTFKTGVVAVLVFSLSIMVLGIALHKLLAKLLGATGILYADTAKYIFTLSFFVPCICFLLMCGFSCRLLERPNLYLLATILCLCSNILLDFIFIYFLKMSVVGAAISTGLSYTMCLIPVVVPFCRRKTIVNFFKGKIRFSILKDILLNGSSEGVSYLALAISIFFMNKCFMQFSAEDGIAAFTAINFITSFEELIMLGVADGVASITSCNYGARRIKRVKNTQIAAIVVNLIIGGIFYSLLCIVGKNIISIFIPNNIDILSIAVSGAKLYGIAFLLNGFNILQSSYHTAIGHTVASVMIATARGIVFIIIGILILPRFLGVNGIWLTLPFAELVTVFVSISIILFYKKNKLNIK